MNKLLKLLFPGATAQLFSQIVQQYKLVFKAKDIQSLPYYWALVPDNQPMGKR